MDSWWPDLVEALRRGAPRVLVSVARVSGSTPRDVGARMWVGSDVAVDTIGGGNLEWKVIGHAREMLDDAGRRRDCVRFPLGPSLGQCCGGVVWLVFERLTPDDLPWCDGVLRARREGRALRRRVDLSNGAPVVIEDGGIEPRPMDDAIQPVIGGKLAFIDLLAPPFATVIVCGAGHVGQAIVRLLGELPLRVIWLDPRDDCWPARSFPNVRRMQGDQDEVPDLPDDAWWLVLTHSHALDLAIVEAILRHRRFAFLGLIGSRTKRARFASRLQRRFAADQIARIQCPIGLAPVHSKLPAAIAVSVVAQLLSEVGL